MFLVSCPVVSSLLGFSDFFDAGYTILDSVIIVNGTFFVVTDDPSAFPTLGSISSSQEDNDEPPVQEEWQIVTTEEAKQLGTFGAS